MSTVDNRNGEFRKKIVCYIQIILIEILLKILYNACRFRWPPL